jgi:hypothetical protein
MLFIAQFISTALGGRTVLVGAQFYYARFIRIVFGGRIVPVRAPRFIRIAFSGRIVLVGPPRFIRIAFGGRIILAGAQFLIARFISTAFVHLKIHKLSYPWRLPAS